MPTYISLLRGINVGGHKKIRMQDLREAYHRLGFRNIQTYIQSGNVVFDCPETDTENIQKQIEEGIRHTFGFDVTAVMRSKKEWQRLVESTHFSKEKEEAPNKFCVIFLSERPDDIPPIEDFDRIRSESEILLFDGKEIYLHCPDGFAQTKLSNNFFEKKLKIPATARNWKTVTMLHKLMG